MIKEVKIRKEQKRDHVKVRMINQWAFPTNAEATLVDKVRLELVEYISLVAEYENKVVGHILFTPVTLTGNSTDFKWCSLAPMAVEPLLQKQGIGSKLVKAGLHAISKEGYDGVCVLGHPEYYPRFGFKPATQFEINCEFKVPDETFMVLEVTKGTLESCSGIVKYNQLFQEL